MQGAQILRNEAYFSVRRSDEGCSVTPQLGSFCDAQRAGHDGPAWHIPLASRGMSPPAQLASREGWEVQEDKGDRG